MQGISLTAGVCFNRDTGNSAKNNSQKNSNDGQTQNENENIEADNDEENSIKNTWIGETGLKRKEVTGKGHGLNRNDVF